MCWIKVRAWIVAGGWELDIPDTCDDSGIRGKLRDSRSCRLGAACPARETSGRECDSFRQQFFATTNTTICANRLHTSLRLLPSYQQPSTVFSQLKPQICRRVRLQRHARYHAAARAQEHPHHPTARPHIHAPNHQTTPAATLHVRARAAPSAPQTAAAAAAAALAAATAAPEATPAAPRPLRRSPCRAARRS